MPFIHFLSLNICICITFRTFSFIVTVIVPAEIFPIITAGTRFLSRFRLRRTPGCNRNLRYLRRGITFQTLRTIIPRLRSFSLSFFCCFRSLHIITITRFCRNGSVHWLSRRFRFLFPVLSRLRFIKTRQTFLFQQVLRPLRFTSGEVLIQFFRFFSSSHSNP